MASYSRRVGEIVRGHVLEPGKMFYSDAKGTCWTMFELIFVFIYLNIKSPHLT